jgi:CRISPR-associated protein Cmr5
MATTLTLNKHKPVPLTLEQQRAADAWQRCQGQPKDYANLAKGLPALIMNSGLMQVLAFLHEKGSKDKQKHCEVLREHLCLWLKSRFPTELPNAEFGPFMQALMKTEPRTFQLVTTEAFAWLRWVRQMAPAVLADAGEK